jgi:multimeric flavodoxin WrbA
MPDVVLTESGRKAFDNILSRWAPQIQGRRGARINRIISLLMTERGVKAADQALVIEATRMIVDKGFEPFLHMLEDPEGYASRRRAHYEDLAAYYARPVIVTRWPSTVTPPPKPASQMKVLALQASPRKKGNTDLLLDEALRGMSDAGAQTEKVFLQGLDMKFCIGCRKCKEPGWTQREASKWCSLKDDMTGLYPKLEACDALVVAFPIYTGRDSAQLCTFWDRLDCLRSATGQRLEPGKRRGMIIATWGYPYTDTYDHVIERFSNLLHMHMIEPMEAISCCGLSGLLEGWDENGKAIILRHPDEVKKAYEAGRALVTGVA